MLAWFGHVTFPKSRPRPASGCLVTLLTERWSHSELFPPVSLWITQRVHRPDLYPVQVFRPPRAEHAGPSRWAIDELVCFLSELEGVWAGLCPPANASLATQAHINSLRGRHPRSWVESEWASWKAYPGTHYYLNLHVFIFKLSATKIILPSITWVKLVNHPFWV